LTHQLSLFCHKASNEFFYQFPNCLAYDDIDDCVVKLQYALENKPEKLSEKYRHILSWEGATERLFVASGISEKEELARRQDGSYKSDLKAAEFHVHSSHASSKVKNTLGLKFLRRNPASSDKLVRDETLDDANKDVSSKDK
jgi:hypothetical protein